MPHPVAPGPSKLELLAGWRKLHAAPLAGLERLARAHGDVVRVSMGRDYFLVSGPAAIRHVLRDNRKNYDKAGSFDELRLLIGDGLLTARNEAWVAQRRVLAKAFVSGAVDAELPRAAAAALADEWDAELGTSPETGRLVSADFARLTLRLSSRALLGADASADTAEVGHALDRAQTALTDRMKSVAKVPLGVPTPRNLELRRAIGALDGILARVMAALAGRAAGDHPGFLRRVAALPDQVRVRDEAMTFLLAGYDTTSNALAFTSYLLARHPAEQARARRDPAHLDRVIAESLRLYPPVPIMLRDVLADDTLGGYPVRAGSVVACIPYLAHRHPGHWDEPEAFRPDRFAAGDDLPAYLPFGVMPRGCIGEQMALVWMKAVLSTLLSRFELRPEPGFVLEPEALITLVPRHGVRVRLARAASQALTPTEAHDRDRDHHAS